MLKTPKPPHVQTTASQPLRNIGQPPKAEVSLWVRVGIPIGLSILAAGLNLAAVRQQLQPTLAYALTEDLPVGTLLRAEHLQVVEVAGGFDRSCLVTPADILQKSERGVVLGLPESLASSPRILSRQLASGDLMMKSSLAGRATAEPGTEVISVPRSLISGGGLHLQPGQTVHFVAQKRHNSLDAQPSYIGPFRVALEEVGQRDQPVSDRRGTIALVYPLNERGQRDESARLLHEAALHDNQYTLVIIEKANAKSSSRSSQAAAKLPRSQSAAPAARVQQSSSSDAEGH